MNNKVKIHEKAILIRINKLYHDSMTAEEMYEATRGVWRVGPRKDEADYAFTVYKGEVKEVYKINSWLPAGTLLYSTRPRTDIELESRWEFDGSLAEDAIRKKYISKSVKEYLPRGAANPITYINC